MKKMKFLLSAILVLALSLTYTSCKETTKKEASTAEVAEKEEPQKETPKKDVAPAELLAGKWILKDMKIASKEDLKEMKELFAAMEKELAGKLSYEFNANKTSVVSTPSIMGQKEKQEKGTWALSADNKTINTTAEGGTKQDLTIVSLDENNLVLSVSDEMGTQTMTFTKG